MGMKNAKSLKRALETFRRQHGREPSIEEFRMLVSGKITKKQKED
jgi:hypothetical protein